MANPPLDEFTSAQRVASRWARAFLFGAPSIVWLFLIVVDLLLQRTHSGLPALPSITLLDEPYAMPARAYIAWALLPIQLFWAWRVTRKYRLLDAMRIFAKYNLILKKWRDLSVTKFVLFLLMGIFFTVFWLGWIGSDKSSLEATAWGMVMYVFENWLCLQGMLLFDTVMVGYLVLAKKGWN